VFDHLFDTNFYHEFHWCLEMNKFAKRVERKPKVKIPSVIRKKEKLVQLTVTLTIALSFWLFSTPSYA